jgi:hypothetical protein
MAIDVKFWRDVGIDPELLCVEPVILCGVMCL